MKIIPVNYKFNRLPIKLASHYGDAFCETEHYVVKKGEQKVASFDFSLNGDVSNLEVKKIFRRTKTAMDALLSIREILFKRAKEEGLDFLNFYTQGTKRHLLDYFKFWYKPNKNKQLEKLYQHLGAEMIEYNPKGSRFIGIINPSKRAEILEQLDLQESTPSPEGFLETMKGLFQ